MTSQYLRVINLFLFKQSIISALINGSDEKNPLDLDSVDNMDVVFKFTGRIYNVNINPGDSFYPAQ